MDGLAKRRIAKQLTLVENGGEGSRELLDEIWPRCGRAFRIGITGPPGAGKSTLVDRIARHYLDRGLKLALVMVDPSSPFSGGALLGDRLRLNSLSGHPNIFIRSMATRGSLGGLARKTRELCDVLDGSGFDIILIETVGVGQVELDISRSSDIAVVVLVPESGDEVQTMKAGLMEIGGLFVVNKADREGAGRLEIHLRSMLQLKGDSGGWKVPVLKTVATRDEGLTQVMESLDRYLDWLKKTETWQDLRRQRLEYQVQSLVQDALNSGYWTETRRSALQEILVRGEILSPFDIKEQLNTL